ncbi:OmpA family protein [Rhodobacteraceae bacterium CYK-10]|uniref:OmpA family protein n=2 Tax=Stagnihabitans tardus TaxID=2699202 RepID=A0AAE4YBC3_9RHOB|nr:OmpA family protein [Stagnihabitans tardus]
MAAPALAEDNPFAPGWTLNPLGSTLGFQSVKNGTKVEMNNIATFGGHIAPDGMAEVQIALDSIDTHIDLRNVRMRFLFFETFKFPTATVTAKVDPLVLEGLKDGPRTFAVLPFTLTLHGVTKEMSAPISITQLGPDTVAVASVGVIPVVAEDFALTEGVAKLEDAAKVKLLPVGSVSFDWIFTRDGAAPMVAALTTGADAAKETRGAFDAEACATRFDTLSQAGNITFRSGSARLDVAGSAVLDTLLDVVTRCPEMKIEIGGHTDDVGPDAANLALSEARAAAVAAYLAERGAGADRLTPKGYGEAAPLLPNDSAENRARNRRIEFKILD